MQMYARLSNFESIAKAGAPDSLLSELQRLHSRRNKSDSTGGLFYR